MTELYINQSKYHWHKRRSRSGRLLSVTEVGRHWFEWTVLFTAQLARQDLARDTIWRNFALALTKPFQTSKWFAAFQCNFALALTKPFQTFSWFAAFQCFLDFRHYCFQFMNLLVNLVAFLESHSQEWSNSLHISFGTIFHKNCNVFFWFFG